MYSVSWILILYWIIILCLVYIIYLSLKKIALLGDNVLDQKEKLDILTDLCLGNYWFQLVWNCLERRKWCCTEQCKQETKKCCINKCGKGEKPCSGSKRKYDQLYKDYLKTSPSKKKMKYNSFRRYCNKNNIQQ